jgi:hypothetical protein
VGQERGQSHAHAVDKEKCTVGEGDDGGVALDLVLLLCAGSGVADRVG